LGLAIAHKIVELHGSTLEVESTVGEGTVFHFTLPTVEARTEVPA
jgi:signal transduction histidine kinase